MDEKSSAARERIVDEFQRLVFLQGYNKTTLRQLADVCGMSKGHIGFYFKKKEEIMIAQKRRFLRNLTNVLIKCDELYKDDILRFSFFSLAFMYVLNRKKEAYLHMSEMSRNSIYINWRLKESYNLALPLFVERGICNRDDLLHACVFCTYGLYGSIQHEYASNTAFDYKENFCLYLKAFFMIIGFSQGDDYIEKVIQIFDAFDKEKMLQELYPDS